MSDDLSSQYDPDTGMFGDLPNVDVGTTLDYMSPSYSGPNLPVSASPSIAPSTPAASTVQSTSSTSGILGGLGNLLGGLSKVTTSVGSAVSMANANAVYDASGKLVALGGKPVSSLSGISLAGMSTGTLIIIGIIAYLVLRK